MPISFGGTGGFSLYGSSGGGFNLYGGGPPSTMSPEQIAQLVQDIQNSNLSQPTGGSGGSSKLGFFGRHTPKVLRDTLQDFSDILVNSPAAIYHLAVTNSPFRTLWDVGIKGRDPSGTPLGGFVEAANQAIQGNFGQAAHELRIEPNVAFGEQMGRSYAAEARHPLRHPGFTLLDAFGLVSPVAVGVKGASAVTRATLAERAARRAPLLEPGAAVPEVPPYARGGYGETMPITGPQLSIFGNTKGPVATAEEIAQRQAILEARGEQAWAPFSRTKPLYAINEPLPEVPMFPRPTGQLGARGQQPYYEAPIQPDRLLPVEPHTAPDILQPGPEQLAIAQELFRQGVPKLADVAAAFSLPLRTADDIEAVKALRNQLLVGAGTQYARSGAARTFVAPEQGSAAGRYTLPDPNAPEPMLPGETRARRGAGFLAPPSYVPRLSEEQAFYKQAAADLRAQAAGPRPEPRPPPPEPEPWYNTLIPPEELLPPEALASADNLPVQGQLGLPLTEIAGTAQGPVFGRVPTPRPPAAPTEGLLGEAVRTEQEAAALLRTPEGIINALDVGREQVFQLGRLLARQQRAAPRVTRRPGLPGVREAQELPVLQRIKRARLMASIDVNGTRRALSDAEKDLLAAERAFTEVAHKRTAKGNLPKAVKEARQRVTDASRARNKAVTAHDEATKALAEHEATLDAYQRGPKPEAAVTPDEIAATEKKLAAAQANLDRAQQAARAFADSPERSAALREAQAAAKAAKEEAAKAGVYKREGAPVTKKPGPLPEEELGRFEQYPGQLEVPTETTGLPSRYPMNRRLSYQRLVEDPTKPGIFGAVGEVAGEKFFTRQEEKAAALQARLKAAASERAARAGETQTRYPGAPPHRPGRALVPFEGTFAETQAASQEALDALAQQTKNAEIAAAAEESVFEPHGLTRGFGPLEQKTPFTKPRYYLGTSPRAVAYKARLRAQRIQAEKRVKNLHGKRVSLEQEGLIAQAKALQPHIVKAEADLAEIQRRERGIKAYTIKERGKEGRVTPEVGTGRGKAERAAVERAYSDPGAPLGHIARLNRAIEEELSKSARAGAKLTEGEDARIAAELQDELEQMVDTMGQAWVDKHGSDALKEFRKGEGYKRADAWNREHGRMTYAEANDALRIERQAEELGEPEQLWIVRFQRSRGLTPAGKPEPGAPGEGVWDTQEVWATTPEYAAAHVQRSGLHAFPRNITVEDNLGRTAVSPSHEARLDAEAAAIKQEVRRTSGTPREGVARMLPEMGEGPAPTGAKLGEAEPVVKKERAKPPPRTEEEAADRVAKTIDEQIARAEAYAESQGRPITPTTTTKELSGMLAFAKREYPEYADDIEAALNQRKAEIAGKPTEPTPEPTEVAGPRIGEPTAPAPKREAGLARTLSLGARGLQELGMTAEQAKSLWQKVESEVGKVFESDNPSEARLYTVLVDIVGQDFAKSIAERAWQKRTLLDKFSSEKGELALGRDDVPRGRTYSQVARGAFQASRRTAQISTIHFAQYQHEPEGPLPAHFVPGEKPIVEEGRKPDAVPGKIVPLHRVTKMDPNHPDFGDEARRLEKEGVKVGSVQVPLSRNALVAAWQTNLQLPLLRRFPDQLGPVGGVARRLGAGRKSFESKVRFEREEVERIERSQALLEEVMSTESLEEMVSAFMDSKLFEGMPNEAELAKMTAGERQMALGDWIDGLNQMAKVAVLFAKPAYIPANLIGQMFVSLADHGWNPVDLVRTVDLQRELYGGKWAKEAGGRLPVREGKLAGKRAMRIKAAMYQGFIEALYHEKGGIGKSGAGAKSYETLAKGFSRILDTPFRDAAFIKEARRFGYDTAEKIGKLVDESLPGQKFHDEFIHIARRANRNAIDYSRMSKLERNAIRRMIFFYPWFKAATIYGGHFAAEHPLQALVMAQGSKEAQLRQEEELPDLPSYMKGVFKYGERDVPGLGKVPTVINPAAASVLGTPGEVINTFLTGFTGQGQGESLADYLSPAAQIGVATSMRIDPFTGEDYPANVGIPDILVAELKKVPAPLRFWKNLEESRGRTPEENQQKLLPADVGELVGRYTLGTYPYAINPKEARSRAAAERQSSMSRRQREFAKHAQYREDWLNEFRRVGMATGDKLPEGLRNAFNMRAQREAEIAEMEAASDGPLLHVQRLQAELSVLVRRGLYDQGQAKNLLQSLVGQPDSVVDSVRRRLSGLFGMEVISAYRRAAEARGAILAGP